MVFHDGIEVLLVDLYIARLIVGGVVVDGWVCNGMTLPIVDEMVFDAAIWLVLHHSIVHAVVKIWN